MAYLAKTPEISAFLAFAAGEEGSGNLLCGGTPCPDIGT